MAYGSGTYGAGTYGSMNDADKVVLAIENSANIPAEIKPAIKDFIIDSFEELWGDLQELLEIQPPTELEPAWEILLKIVEELIKNP